MTASKHSCHYGPDLCEIEHLLEIGVRAARTSIGAGCELDPEGETIGDRFLRSVAIRRASTSIRDELVRLKDEAPLRRRARELMAAILAGRPRWRSL